MGAIFHTHPSSLPSSFDKYEKSTLKRRPYIDVWPLQVTKDDQFDSTCLLILQLACVLHMKDKWKATEIRVFVVVGCKPHPHPKLIYITCSSLPC